MEVFYHEAVPGFRRRTCNPVAEDSLFPFVPFCYSTLFPDQGNEKGYLMHLLISALRPSGFRLEHFALILLLLFHLVMNLWWLRADNHGIQSDEELHMLSARSYYDALFPVNENVSLAERLRNAWEVEVESESPVHPPLLPLTGALVMALFGCSTDVLAFCSTCFFLLMLPGVYLIARKFLSRRHALYSTAVVSFTPLIYTASRYFMTDYLSMVLCVWAVAVLLHSRSLTRTRSAFFFGLLNGFALLARITSPLYYFLPAFFIFVTGLLESRRNRKMLARLLMNAALILAVTIAIAAPWYISHGEHFYRYWTASELIRQTGSPIAWLSKNKDRTSSVSAPRPRQKTPPEKTADDTASTRTAMASHPETPAPAAAEKDAGKIPWRRYPVMVINNGVFLPMFLAGVAGMLCAVVFRRFRRNPGIRLLFLWLLGSWFFLTVVLTFATPRYALQALPALALFSALPFLMLPERRAAALLQGLYLAVLLFQYGNLTVAPYGTLCARALPLEPDPEMMARYDDSGLWWYKEELHGSYAYSGMGAPAVMSYKDRIFLAMLKEEQVRPYSGIEANYVRVNMRGMGLEEARYRPDLPGRRNPWKCRDLPETLQPWRSFRHFGWSHDIEEILPMLVFADYAVYTTEYRTPEEEQRWLDIFAQEGFELVDRFHDRRHGMVGEKYFGVLARRTEETLPRVEKEEDVLNLDLTALYRLRHSKEWLGLRKELQQAAASRLETLFQGMGSIRWMNESVGYAGCGVSREGEGLYLLHLIFRTTGIIDRDWRILVQGQVDARTMAQTFGSATGQAGIFRWPVLPSPVTSLWPGGDYVIARVPLRTRHAVYAMDLRFFDTKLGQWGDVAPLGMVTLAE